MAGGHRRALVADDEPINQQLLSCMLERLGFECDMVSDGQQAINALVHRAYDVLVMDCQMPTIGGRAAALAIRVREIDGHHQRTPIIAVTAHRDRVNESDCIAAGMDAFLNKPVDLKTLATTLERLLPTRTESGTLIAVAERTHRMPLVCLSEAPER